MFHFGLSRAPARPTAFLSPSSIFYTLYHNLMARAGVVGFSIVHISAHIITLKWLIISFEAFLMSFLCSSTRASPGQGRSKTLAIPHSRHRCGQSEHKSRQPAELVDRVRSRYVIHTLNSIPSLPLTERYQCDARRPCTSCVRRQTTCHFATHDGETHSQASKRRHEEMARSHDVYAEIFYMLGHRSERHAAEILSRVRSGHDPQAVLRLAKMGDVSSVVPDPGRLALEAFLVLLAHSTGSLQDIIRVAKPALDPAKRNDLPNLQAFLEFRNRIVRLPRVEALLRRFERVSYRSLLGGATKSSDSSPQPELVTQSNPVENDDGTSGGSHTPYQVPAAPWTSVTASDEAVSHLVSLFLAWINPTWRFVEQDLFLLSESL